MAILQQFDFDIMYKPAAQMTVPDALWRNIEYAECMDSSPEEENPYFPYVDEKPTQIRVMTPNQTMEKLFPEVNFVHAQQFQTHPYDPGESLPPCRGLWGTLHTGDDIDCNTCLLWEC